MGEGYVDMKLEGFGGMTWMPSEFGIIEIDHSDGVATLLSDEEVDRLCGDGGTTFIEGWGGTR